MTVPWKSCVLLVSSCHFLFESWLTLRQVHALKQATVPSLLTHELDEQTVKKSHAYKQAKARLSLASGLWSQFVNAAVVYLDMLPWLWNSVGRLLEASAPAFATNSSRSVIFALCYLWLYQSVYLPVQVYDTFIVEAIFGFNRQTPGLFLRDFIKIQALNSLILGPSLALFMAIISVTRDSFAFYIWLGAAVIQALIISLDPILFTPLFNSLRPLEDKNPLPRVKSLTAEVGFPLDRMYVSDNSKRSAHSNAYFYGFPWQMQVVVQDTLLEKASKDEIVAIIAHELGHWNFQHSVKLFLIQQINLLVIFLSFSFFANSADLYHSFGFQLDKPIIASFILFCKILLPVNSILQLIHNSICRRYEFSADRFVKDIGKGHDLAGALIKLHAQNLGAVSNDWLYSCYHHSHPSLLERLASLGMKEKL